MNKLSHKLTPYLKASYGLADLGFIFMVTLSNTYLLMYFTDVIGIAAGVAGGLMMVGRIIAIMVGAPLILILNSLLFTDIPLEGSMKVIVTCLVYAAFCISTNVTYIGYTSLNASLTNNPKERVGLSTLRGQGNAAGKILAGFLLLPMITLLGGTDALNSQGFLTAAMIAGGVCLLFYVNLLNATKNFKQEDTKVAKAQEKLTAMETLKLVVSTKPLMVLFVADLTRILNMLILFAMFPYFFKYVVGDMGAMSTFFGIVNILALIGATSVPLLTRYISKKILYISGNILLATALILSFFNSGNVNLLITFISIGYLGYSWANVVNTSMYADTVDYSQWKTRSEERRVGKEC